MLIDSERFAFDTRHHFAFATTGNAYDAVQTNEAIATGATLLVLPEKVVGIAMTWPFAVTAKAGKLHPMNTPEPGESLATIACELGVTEADMRHAIELAKVLHFPLDPGLEPFA